MNPFKKTFTTILVAALCSPFALAQDDGDSKKRPGRGNPGQRFEKLDADKNGELSESEVPARLWKRISQADTDGSGGVSKAEMKAHREARRKARAESGEGRPGGKKRGGRGGRGGKRRGGGGGSDGGSE